MIFVPRILIAATLLIQLVSCSYEVVCRTKYSHVLKQFNKIAVHFQNNLPTVENCLNYTCEDRSECFRRKFNCLSDAGISTLYAIYLVYFNGENTSIRLPLTVPAVNSLHREACIALNTEAKGLKYAEDIENKKYNVLTESEQISTLLETLKIN